MDTDTAEQRRERRLQRRRERYCTESVKIAKHLMRERGDFLGADKGMQLVNNRVSDPKFKYSG